MSHSWLWRVLRQAGLPSRLILCIQRLVGTQHSILAFAGICFQSIEMQCGLRQGGPLSGYLYIIAVDPFLKALRGTAGVLHVFAFCDD